MPVEVYEDVRHRYVSMLTPLFFPDNPTKPDVIQLFASLLRIVGMEDRGWDPYSESLNVLQDLYSLMQLELPQDNFTNIELTKWRLGLLAYNHIVEMSAPYEVLTNLLRYRLGKGYSPNPYYDFMNSHEQTRYKKSGFFYTSQKIKVIKRLCKEAKLHVGDIFDEFYNNQFRNAIAHSDFIVTDNKFRCRNDNLKEVFQLSLDELNDLITKATVFINTFFELERKARHFWGGQAGKSIAYDPRYKGVLEILIDSHGLMNGFTIHWPNGSDSTYRRTENGVAMTNCMMELQNPTLTMMVGLYAQNPSDFSPLVKAGEAPDYTPLENGTTTVWEPVAPELHINK